jgi:hypothetical protein
MGTTSSSRRPRRLHPGLVSLLTGAVALTFIPPAARGQFTGGLRAASLRLADERAAPTAALPSFSAPATLAPPTVAVTRRLAGPDFAASTLRRPFLFLPLVQVGLASDPAPRPSPLLPLQPSPTRRPGPPGFALPPEPAAFAFTFPTEKAGAAPPPSGIQLVDRYAGHTVTFTGGTMSLPRQTGLALGAVRPVRNPVAH